MGPSCTGVSLLAPYLHCLLIFFCRVITSCCLFFFFIFAGQTLSRFSHVLLVEKPKRTTSFRLIELTSRFQGANIVVLLLLLRLLLFLRLLYFHHHEAVCHQSHLQIKVFLPSPVQPRYWRCCVYKGHETNVRVLITALDASGELPGNRQRPRPCPRPRLTFSCAAFAITSKNFIDAQGNFKQTNSATTNPAPPFVNSHWKANMIQHQSDNIVVCSLSAFHIQSQVWCNTIGLTKA